MNKAITGTVIEMDATQMKATVVVDDETIIKVSVERKYNFGEEIKVSRSWYYQEDEEIDDSDIRLTQGCIKGIRLG